MVQAAIIQAPPTGAPAGIVNVAGAGVSGVEVSRFVIQRGPLSGFAAWGIHVQSGASLRSARHNLIRRIDADGIGIQTGAAAPDISYNRIEEYGDEGIFVGGTGTSATMSFNTIVGQATPTAGIAILSGAKASAVGNRIAVGNALAGIVVSQPVPSGVSLKGNQLFDNVRGILLSAAQGALVASNRVSRNTAHGIIADIASRGNTFDRNDARSNGGIDCQDDSVGSGTAGTDNTWTFNRGIESVPPGICTP